MTCNDAIQSCFILLSEEIRVRRERLAILMLSLSSSLDFHWDNDR